MSIWPVALLALITATNEQAATQGDDNVASTVSPTPDLLEYMDEFDGLDGLDLEGLPAVSPAEDVENVEQTLHANAPRH